MDEEYFPTNQEFFIGLPLYSCYKVNEKNFPKLREFMRYDGPLDTYCVQCGRESVFNVQFSPVANTNLHRNNWSDSLYIHFMAYCSRDRDHTASYSFKLDDEEGVTKVGQYPSMADADGVKLKKYRSVLDKELHSGFSKAVGLVSHGVGAGAVVYLRRIFESLIEGAHAEAKKDSDWVKLHEAEYAAGRVADRVKSLRNYLPSYLVDHHTMYGVLSSGVHNMSEQECLELFPTLRIGIELILDQKIQKKEEAEKVAALQKMLSGKASGSR